MFFFVQEVGCFPSINLALKMKLYVYLNSENLEWQEAYNLKTKGNYLINFCFNVSFLSLNMVTVQFASEQRVLS